MTQFRKRPVVIDAVQWHVGMNHPDVVEPYCDGTDPFARFGRIITLEDTKNSTHFVTDGDWIITGVHGEKYPCKADIFEKTYEKIDDEL